MIVATIVGARPQLVKAAALSPVLRRRVTEVLIHTGQHYDFAMSQVFFEQLPLPAADHHLGVGSMPHGEQTGTMLQRLEPLLSDIAPDWVLVYGDTNSTLAGALAAAKLGLRVVHVEAGMRSFVRGMPEEINRIVADHVSVLRLCSTATAVANLAREGLRAGVHQVGDLMAELLAAELPRVAALRVAERLGLRPGHYVLATIHRAANTASREVLERLIAGLAQSSRPVLLPLHPRTRAAVQRFDVAVPPPIRVIEPLGYREMLALERDARVIATDSGGVQKEAYLLGVPCLTLREETEWPETVDAGWNLLVGARPPAIAAGLCGWQPSGARPPFFGTGSAAERIVEVLVGGTAMVDDDP